jgi:hypothetical protein
MWCDADGEIVALARMGAPGEKAARRQMRIVARLVEIGNAGCRNAGLDAQRQPFVGCPRSC